MKVKRIALLLVVLALVIALEVALMHSCTRDDAAANPTAAPEPTAEPATETPTPLATNIPEAPGFTSPPGGGGSTAPTRPPATNAPAPTQAPATQAPTDPPEPPPVATNIPPDQVGGTLSGGSFASNTGTGLNMNVSWSALNQGNGTARITVTGTVNSYALNVSALPVTITYGSYSTTVMGKSIQVTSSASISSNTLFTATLDVPADSADTMTVAWHYNGTYSEVALDDITASGYVYT